ncbi:DUF397 domain-containing protein [Streptomyces sp. NPDC017993]|uniref:DUF397 domain-containing protein n=1 Tax=Streptomyces sp. NPDC017993 TaxID=3365027 RepID=UPI00379570A1
MSEEAISARDTSGRGAAGEGSRPEDALTWRKSGHSDDFDRACLELAAGAGPDALVYVRDSTRAGGGSQLTFAAPAWSLFIAYITAD